MASLSLSRLSRRLAGALVLAVLTVTGRPAWAKCELGSVATLPVTMLGMRALAPAKINGNDVQFAVDSGAFYSFITPPNAAKFKLPLHALPRHVVITGVTGDVDAAEGVVDVLTLANATLHNVEFVVGGGEVGAGAVGLLGQNVLGRFDVEYDLAKGEIHFWKPTGCSRQSDMVYWSSTAPEAVIDLYDDDRYGYVTHIAGPVYVNGVRLTAEFDTGAPVSTMTRQAAARAGIRPNDPGVAPAGYTGGLGTRVARTWVAQVKSFKIGNEEVRNTKMLFGELDLMNADMLVGADFFLAHHVFVSNQQHKLYLTYNGGPIFDLSQTPILIAQNAPGAASPAGPSGGAAAAAPPSPPSSAVPPSSSEASEPDPTDAAGFARRGAGFAARNAFAPAIADLSKAIALAPTVPDYRYERGLFYLRNKQPFLAMADFDETLKLKPDAAPALVARASLHLAGRDKTEALQDLDAADKASAKQDDIRLEIANLYARAEMAPAAIEQYSLWIDSHPDDSRLPVALNSRCWQRALTGVDLDTALNDCNRAIRNAPKNASMFDSRGLVHLRQGELDKAIADYDASLALNPKLGWSLYGRGLAKQRKGLAAEGAADIAAATALNPRLPAEAKAHGLTP